jgi:signal transduction histidine kinase
MAGCYLFQAFTYSQDMWNRRRQHHASLLDHYSRQLGLLVNRRQTELGLNIARREAEGAAEQARHAMLSAEAANRAKTQFLANMSHELRTPLNAIIGFAEVIAINQVSSHDKIREYARDIHSSGQHLLNVINDILDIARIEAGSLDLREEWTDVRSLVEMPLDVCRQRIAENSLTLKVNVEANLPDLYCDGRLVLQMLINLLSNAAKFTPQGGQITVSVATDANQDLLMSVADTGIGIAPEHVADALAPFRQEDNELQRRYDGTGLGLPLSKAFIELHGGSLSLESQPGKGTTVTLRFPRGRLRDIGTPACESVLMNGTTGS